MDTLFADDHVMMVGGIILVAGLLGGWAGYLMSGTDEGEKKRGVGRWLVLGVVASALMPLALSILSSPIVADSAREPYQYFVFGGLCLIAAVFSNKFIALVGENVLRRLSRAERAETETRKRVEALIDSHIADEDLPPMKKRRKGAARPGVEQSITALLVNAPPARWYSAAALSRSTGHPEHHIAEELNKLRERGVVKTITRSDGSEYWAVNPRNRTP